MISARRKIFHWIVFDGDYFAHRCDVSDRTFQPRLCGIRRCVRRDAAGRPTRVFGTRAQLAFTLLKIALRNTQQGMRSPIFSCVRSGIGRITFPVQPLALFARRLEPVLGTLLDFVGLITHLSPPLNYLMSNRRYAANVRVPFVTQRELEIL